MTSVGTVVSGPTPPYSNPPIDSDAFQPSQFTISAVTLGFPTLVTTSVNHNYVVGQEVRLLIPASYGCFQLNGLLGYVLSVPAPNQVNVDINSSVGVNSFKSGSAKSVPQIVAVGDINSGNINSSGNLNTGTAPPGSFINISPN